MGSRLVPALVAAGWEVVAAGRDVDRLRRFPWADDVALTELDVLDEESTAAAFADHGRIDVAFYLVHAIGEGDFVAKDEQSAQVFAAQSAAARVGRIVYLGGFVPVDQELSEHLASRDQVGAALTAGEVEVIWLRAAVIIGAGSTSYELIRYLADRLPVIPIPSWMNNPVAPIAVDDVLHYLTAAAASSLPAGHYDITGPDTLSYRQLIAAYVSAAGLRRVLVPTPGVSTGIAGAVIGWLTPLPSALAKDLIDSLHNTMSSRDTRIRDMVPGRPDGLTTVAAAMERAQPRPGTARADLPDVEHTPDPLLLTGTDPAWAGGDRYESLLRRTVYATGDQVWSIVETIGDPTNGFFSWPLAWRIRGYLDKLVGGPGTGQHHAEPGRLTVGDTVSFLTVTDIADHHLSMSTDHFAPGVGTLEIWVEQASDNPRRVPAVRVQVRARWIPRGLAGRLYWLALKPFHGVIFPGMLRRICLLAEESADQQDMAAA